jgi:hypothetical protein
MALFNAFSSKLFGPLSCLRGNFQDGQVFSEKNMHLLKTIGLALII